MARKIFLNKRKKEKKTPFMIYSETINKYEDEIYKKLEPIESDLSVLDNAVSEVYINIFAERNINTSLINLDIEDTDLIVGEAVKYCLGLLTFKIKSDKLYFDDEVEIMVKLNKKLKEFCVKVFKEGTHNYRLLIDFNKLMGFKEIDKSMKGIKKFGF